MRGLQIRTMTLDINEIIIRKVLSLSHWNKLVRVWKIDLQNQFSLFVIYINILHSIPESKCILIPIYICFELCKVIEISRENGGLWPWVQSMFSQDDTSAKSMFLSSNASNYNLCNLPNVRKNCSTNQQNQNWVHYHNSAIVGCWKTSFHIWSISLHLPGNAFANSRCSKQVLSCRKVN